MQLLSSYVGAEIKTLQDPKLAFKGTKISMLIGVIVNEIQMRGSQSGRHQCTRAILTVPSRKTVEKEDFENVTLKMTKGSCLEEGGRKYKRFSSWKAEQGGTSLF